MVVARNVKRVLLLCGLLLVMLIVQQSLISTKYIRHRSEPVQKCTCDQEQGSDISSVNADDLQLPVGSDEMAVVPENDISAPDEIPDHWKHQASESTEDTNITGVHPDDKQGFQPQAVNESKAGPQTDLVLLLAYQRTGSSYIGDVLFNSNEDIFYLFEPLDLIYSTMFGVAPGWTVPGDITTHHNGSLRIPPSDERRAASWMLNQFYTCNMTAFPLGAYTHVFWKSFSRHMSTLVSYVQCLRVEKLVGKISGTCRPFIKQMCGTRFEERGRRQDLCKRHLWEHQHVSLTSNTLHGAFSRHGEMSSFAAYDRCIEQYHASISKCIPRLSQPCDDRKRRAIKTVRATMDNAEDLLKAHPNMKVIHLIRDARAVSLSRKKAGWSQSIYERGKGLGIIAHSYCQTVLRDHTRRLELEKLYPGRTMSLIYDEFLLKPVDIYKQVYSFLNWKLPDNLPLLLHMDTYNQTLIEEKRQKWKKEVTESQRVDIYDACYSLARKLNVNWLPE